MRKPVRMLLFAGGAAVLVYLVSRIGVQVVVDMLRRVGWGFPIVTALYGVHIAVRALALWATLKHLPCAAPSYADVLRVRLSGEAVEMLTFTGPFLAEPAKGWLLAGCGVTGADAFGAVAIEYLLYTLVSSWMAAVALSVLLVRGVLPQAMRTPIVAVIAGLIAFTLGCIVAAVLEVGLIERIVRALGQVIGRERTERVSVRIAPVEKVLVGFMHAQPGGLFQVLTIEAAGHALLAMEIWIVIQALALPARPSDPFVVEGGVKFISAAFFFIPGQIGASESVYAFLFNLLGLTAAAGLTMALVRRVRALIIAGAGLGVLALFKP